MDITRTIIYEDAERDFKVVAIRPVPLDENGALARAKAAYEVRKDVAPPEDLGEATPNSFVIFMDVVNTALAAGKRLIIEDDSTRYIFIGNGWIQESKAVGEPIPSTPKETRIEWYGKSKILKAIHLFGMSVKRSRS